MPSWFVTGGSSGFGRHVTEQLLARGDRVAATVRRPEALDGLRRQYGDALWVAVLDVTDTAAIRRTIDEAFLALGRIDVILSNAGYGLFGAAEEVSDTQIDRQIATNLTGSIQLLRAAVPKLRAQGGGHLLQISSVGGQVSFPLLSVYHATKWGIEGFCESLAAEVAPFGITVTIVEPGGASTQWAAGSADLAEPMPAYAVGPVAGMRARLSSGAMGHQGEPAKMAAAMIAAGDQAEPPLRLTLGSDAFTIMSGKLQARLDALKAQEALARSTDTTTG